MFSFLFGDLSYVLPTLAVIGSIALSVAVLFATRSLQTAGSIFVVCALVCVGLFYRESLLIKGAAQCVETVRIETVYVTEKADTVVVDHQKADQEEIERLKQTVEQLQEQAKQRAKQRLSTGLSPECEQCRVSRSWLRGQRQ